MTLRNYILTCILGVLFFSCQPKRNDNKDRIGRRDNSAYKQIGSVYWEEYERAAMLSDQDKTHEAIKIYRRLNAKEPERCEPYDGLGVCYSKEGDHDSALFYYQKGLRMNPRCVFGLIGIGASYYLIGNDSAAISNYRKAIAIDPELPESYYNLALLYYANKDTVNARIYAAKFIRLAPYSKDISHMENILDQYPQ